MYLIPNADSVGISFKFGFRGEEKGELKGWKKGERNGHGRGDRFACPAIGVAQRSEREGVRYKSRCVGESR